MYTWTLFELFGFGQDHMSIVTKVWNQKNSIMMRIDWSVLMSPVDWIADQTNIYQHFTKKKLSTNDKILKCVYAQTNSILYLWLYCKAMNAYICMEFTHTNISKAFIRWLFGHVCVLCGGKIVGEKESHKIIKQKAKNKKKTEFYLQE